MTRKGKPYTVRYEAVNAMLLNEFLKEHRKVESLEKAMTEQQAENAAMRTILNEQAAQIQKVSDQLGRIQPPMRVVKDRKERSITLKLTDTVSCVPPTLDRFII